MLFATLVTRWLLDLSTPEKDLKWLRRQHWYQQIARLKFYRGLEYFHQLKAWHVYTSTSC